VLIYQLPDAEPDLQWKLEVKNGRHNHVPSINPTAHNVYRKRTQAQKDIIESMSRSGVAPKQILTAIRHQDPDALVAPTDIHNDRKAIRRNYLLDRTPIEALLDELSTSSEWIFGAQKDSESRVQYLFFAHIKQVELLRANPDILLMDCAYKTNKYRLPLLHILGCTNLQTFFSAGFCFLHRETHTDYYWALSTFIRQVSPSLMPGVPQLLCVCNINMNVLTKAQAPFHS
jgi:hypothetical protein